MLLTAQSDTWQTVKQSINLSPVPEYYGGQLLGTKILFYSVILLYYFQGHRFGSVSKPNGLRDQISVVHCSKIFWLQLQFHHYPALIFTFPEMCDRTDRQVDRFTFGRWLEPGGGRLDMSTVARLSAAADLDQTIQGIIGWRECQGEGKSDRRGNLCELWTSGAV
jgi:hypothetical protein